MQNRDSLSVTMFDLPYEQLIPVSQAEVRQQLRLNEKYAEKYATDGIIRQHFDKYAEECGLTLLQKSSQSQPFYNGVACALSIVTEISMDRDLLEEVLPKLYKELES